MLLSSNHTSPGEKQESKGKIHSVKPENKAALCFLKVMRFYAGFLTTKPSQNILLETPPLFAYCIEIQNYSSFLLPSPTFHLSSNISAKLSEKMVTVEGTPFLLGPGGCCPHGWYSSQGLSAGREAGSLAPSLLRHRVLCHSPASKACESSAPRGIIAELLFQRICRLGQPFLQ